MDRFDTLVYSPVNFLFVDWADNGKRFNRCGLPQPRRNGPSISHYSPVCHDTIPVADPIMTYDWERWLPEIIVGVDDPTEEIAADFARAAAIDFCKTTRALQREIVIPIQHGECTYPVPAVDFENVIGVIGAGFNDEHRCRCQGDFCRGWLPNGVHYHFDPARAEIHIQTDRHFRCCGHNDRLRLLVWAAPKEYACEFDSFLYEFFRNEITVMARHNYVRNVHFRDPQLVGSVLSKPEIERMWAIAKLRVASSHSFERMDGRSGLFGRGRMFR